MYWRLSRPANHTSCLRAFSHPCGAVEEHEATQLQSFRWPTCSCLVPQLSSDREINILLKSSTTRCDISCAAVRGTRAANVLRLVLSVKIG